MRILVTGKGKGGAWAIRGAQLGKAIGAKVIPNATRADCQEADLIVVVKRLPPELLDNIRKSGTPWVWDVLDCYPQPRVHQWTLAFASEWMRQQIKEVRPNAVVWPTKAMGEDVGFNGPSRTLYHHCRPMQPTNPIRQDIRVVGYEGSPPYIEGWAETIQRECDRRGWDFIVNPPSLDVLDVVLALRGGQFNGAAARRWKSNVKLANAHGTGTPFIGAPESGYQETETGAEFWATNERELAVAFDWLAEHDTRRMIHDRFLAARIALDDAAKDYGAWLRSLSFC